MINAIPREKDRIRSYRAVRELQAMSPDERDDFLARFEEYDARFPARKPVSHGEEWVSLVVILAIIVAVLYTLCTNI